MPRNATKAADNVFYLARKAAEKCNDHLGSREGAAEETGIDRTRLARIEAGVLVPYPEEVLMMAHAYQAPQLCNHYCASLCPLGKKTIPPCELLHCSCPQAQEYWKQQEAAQRAAEAAEKRRKEQERIQARIGRLIKDSGIRGRFLNRTFERFEVTNINRKAYSAAKRYADSFPIMLPSKDERGHITPPAKERNGLFISGTKGTGKTHLAASIANQLIQGGTPVICMTMIDLLARVKQTFDRPGEATEAEIMRIYEEVPLDYLGRYYNIPVAVEAKHTEDGRIRFDRVEQHQAEYLDDFCRSPAAVGLVVVSFSMRRFFAVPWPFWRAGREAWANCPRRGAKGIVEEYGAIWWTPGQASVSPELLLPEWEIKQGGKFVLPYLDIINDLFAGRDKPHGAE